VNKVSMLSALAGEGDVVDARGRIMRDGKVKARRRLGFDAAGANGTGCSGVLGASDDMTNGSRAHVGRAAVEARVLVSLAIETRCGED